jgi:hypothetical protein
VQPGNRLTVYWLEPSALPRQVYGMSNDDIPAIRQTALDYIEDFYEGDAARMERSLHPELAKRISHPDPVSGRSHLAEMSALALVGFTRDTEGPAAEGHRRIRSDGQRRQRPDRRLDLGRLSPSLELQWPLGDRERSLGDEARRDVRRLLVTASSHFRRPAP